MNERHEDDAALIRQLRPRGSPGRGKRRPPVIPPTPPLVSPRPIADQHRRASGLRSFAWTAYEVEALRRRLGITSWELAMELNVRHGRVKAWERGYYFPRGAELRLLDLVAQEISFTTHDPLIRWLTDRDPEGLRRRNWASSRPSPALEDGYMGAEDGEDLLDKDVL